MDAELEAEDVEETVPYRGYSSLAGGSLRTRSWRQRRAVQVIALVPLAVDIDMSPEMGLE